MGITLKVNLLSQNKIEYIKQLMFNKKANNISLNSQQMALKLNRKLQILIILRIHYFRKKIVRKIK